MVTSDQGNTAYRNGRCVDCLTQPHSAGRPRCTDCHHNYIDRMAKGEI